jgi:DNA polymerase-3 subunit delta
MLIFLYGADSFRQREYLRELKAKFQREVDQFGMSVEELDGEKLAITKLSEISGAVSMFTRKRLIIIDRLFKQKDEKGFAAIAEYLEKQAAGDHIFILLHQSEESSFAPGKGEKLPKYKQGFYDWCAKQPLSKNFSKLSQSELINWLKKRVETKGGQISNDAVATLMAYTAEDLWQLDHEIDKLANLKSGQADGANEGFKIEMADVKAIVQGSFSEHIFALIDAIGERNKSRATKLFEEELLAGQAPEQILAMILRQYKMILSVRDGLERGINEKELEREMKMNSYVMRKVSSQAKLYTVASLKTIFSNLIKLEQQYKTGKIDLVAGLNLFLARI